MFLFEISKIKTGIMGIRIKEYQKWQPIEK